MTTIAAHLHRGGQHQHHNAHLHHHKVVFSQVTSNSSQRNPSFSATGPHFASQEEVHTRATCEPFLLKVQQQQPRSQAGSQHGARRPPRDKQSQISQGYNNSISLATANPPRHQQSSHNESSSVPTASAERLQAYNSSAEQFQLVSRSNQGADDKLSTSTSLGGGPQGKSQAHGQQHYMQVQTAPGCPKHKKSQKSSAANKGNELSMNQTGTRASKSGHSRKSTATTQLLMKEGTAFMEMEQSMHQKKHHVDQADDTSKILSTASAQSENFDGNNLREGGQAPATNLNSPRKMQSQILSLTVKEFNPYEQTKTTAMTMNPQENGSRSITMHQPLKDVTNLPQHVGKRVKSTNKTARELAKYINIKKKAHKVSSFNVPQGLLGASMSQSTSSFGRGSKDHHQVGANYAKHGTHSQLVRSRSRSRSAAENRTIAHQQSDAILQHQLRLEKARSSQEKLKKALEKRPGSGLNWKPELTIPETPRIIGMQPRVCENVYGKRVSRSMVRNVLRSTQASQYSTLQDPYLASGALSRGCAVSSSLKPGASSSFSRTQQASQSQTQTNWQRPSPSLQHTHYQVLQSCNLTQSNQRLKQYFFNQVAPHKMFQQQSRPPMVTRDEVRRSTSISDLL